jgi:signal transduction histidine kinase
MAIPRPHTESGSLLMEVALQFGATLDLDRLLPLVLARITELFSAERSLFALFDEERNVTQAVVHNLEWAGLDSPLPVSQSLLNEVMDKGEPVVIADANRDVDVSARQSVRLFGLRFMTGVPVHGRGRVVGVLYTDSRAEAVRDLSGEVEMMNALARLVGTAVENARLFEEQRFRHVLLGKMVHDFRAPLTVMRAYGDYLNDLSQDAEVQGAAADIRVVTDQMERMMENALELSSIDGGARAVVPQGLDLVSALPEHVRLLAAYARAREIAIVTDLPPELPGVHTLPEQVWIILDNLVFNAIKHARGGTDITVSGVLRDDIGPPHAQRRQSNSAAALFEREAHLQATPASLFIELSVHNWGPCIPEDLLHRLFRQFVRGGMSTGGIKNTGLGLSIADQCTRHLGGAIWVESSAEAGTTFRFTLPMDVEVARSSRASQPLPVRDTMPLTPDVRPTGAGFSAATDLNAAQIPPRNR